MAVGRESRETRVGERPTVLSVFTGAGGLDLGLECAGFEVILCIEKAFDARQTLRTNRPHWRLSEEGDLERLGPKELREIAGLHAGELRLLSAGPPCQPFSKAALWSRNGSKGLKDPRADILSRFMAVVKELAPEAVLLENVRGFVSARQEEALGLLRAEFEDINAALGTSYRPAVIRLNAADYGVPQIRERVFVVAHRKGLELSVPDPTHKPEDHEEVLAGAKEKHFTAWDAIGDLVSEQSKECLQLTGRWANLLPTIPEGKNYLYHTDRGGGEPLFGWRTRYWSFLLKLSKQKPSWTIQASPGPATGPFHWQSRRLSIKELCRLQTFPEGYEIQGSYSSAHRQIGNAVPSAIGELLGKAIRKDWLDEDVGVSSLRMVPERRLPVPKPEPVGELPPEFESLRGVHPPHPGAGKGPQPRSAEEDAT